MFLMLFTSDVATARLAGEADIDAVVVDLERTGKNSRQAGYDLEINHNSLSDVRRIRRATPIPIVVRVNPVSPETRREVDGAIAAGAELLMLPMAAGSGEVESFLAMVGGRARTIVQVETVELAAEILAADDFGRLDWDYCYVGMNDLMVASGKPFWSPLVDGTMEQLRTRLRGRRFGFGGLTLIGKGAPIPCTLLLDEMTRLATDIAILRRSFLRDVAGRDFATEVRRIRDFIAFSRSRTPVEVRDSRRRLVQRIEAQLDPTAVTRPWSSPAGRGRRLYESTRVRRKAASIPNKV